MFRQNQYPKLLESAKFSIIGKDTLTILKPPRHQAIGRGSYGTVFAALYDGKACVVKEMHPYLQGVKRSKNTPVELIFEEINILSSLRHPSIVQFLGVHFMQDNFSSDAPIPILVMERMWKSLYAVLEDHHNELSLVQKVHILHDVACGLQYLHNKAAPIFHRDLNANNILLTENLSAKIGDLGQAKTLELINDKPLERLSTAPGNPLHMPPEALEHKPVYDSSLDIFSLGCIVIHTATEKFPLPTDQFVQSGDSGMFIKQPETQRRQEYLDLMNDCLVLQTIATQCLADTPKDRPSASHICDRLQQYIKQLETEFPALTEQHKQNKLSLIHRSNEEMKSKYDKTISEKDKQILILEQQLQDTRDKIKEDRESFEKEKESLEIKVAERDEMICESSRIYQEQVDGLKKEFSVTCTKLQEQINGLQEKLKHEESNHLQITTDLQTVIKEAENKNQIEQLAFQRERESLQERVCEQEKVNSQLDKVSTEVTNKLQKIEYERESLQRKLAQQENEFINNQIQIEQLRSEKEQLQKSFHASQQEKDAIQKKLDEHQITHQILIDKLREDTKAELNEANLQIQKLQSKLQHKTANLEVFQKRKKITDPGSKLHQRILEIDSTHRDERSSFLATIEIQRLEVVKLQAQLSEVRKKFHAQRQQLEEKSRRLSTLQTLLDESHSKEDKLKSLGEENALLKKQLENNDRIQRNFEKDLKGKEESLKRKEEELQLQKKEHADNISNLQNQYERKLNDLNEDIKMYKSQVVSQEETSTLLKKEAEYQADLEKSTKNRFQNLENERKKLVRSEKSLRKQIKHKDVEIKEKVKQVELLELSLATHPKEHNFDVRWYPYFSLPVKKMRPSVTMIKDRVFVTSGYQSTSPQGRKLEDYSQALDDSMCSYIFCFHLAKCWCDTIASPVQFGALASVNGQCVLVSGADSVGNTLAGNVYVLCEEGSHDQWKEFSKPLPTPRILACACCYGNRWLIVCGGYACRPKEEFSLLEAVSVVEILDITKDEWYTLSEKNRPNFSTILCCSMVGEEVYVVGSDQVIKTSCNKLIKAASSNNTLAWDNVEIETEESNGKLYPFSVVEVNGEPMIIASMSDGEDDVTCVLMKDTRGRWRIMSKAVECQHCSAAVMTSSLELLLFGGSEKISVNEANDLAYKGSLIPTLDIQDNMPLCKMPSTNPLTFESKPINGSVSLNSHIPVAVNQPVNLSFTGPIHTAQFDHNGGTFQSPIHKVSLVVPPNALSDGEKVAVYMGATTSGPFDLPEDCKLRSAVVWLSVSPSDVEFKRSVSVILPHSAVFTSPQHHSMMRFVTCKDRKGPKYKFRHSSCQCEIDEEQGVIELHKFTMVAIAASPEVSCDRGDERVAEQSDSDDDDDFQDAPEDVGALSTSEGVATPPACYLAKLFWPQGELPSSFRADVYILQKLPTEIYKVGTMYKEQYHKQYGCYPEIVDTEFILHTDEVKCVLPCLSSSKCDCLHGWDVIQLNDTNEVQTNEEYQNSTQSKFSLKFICNCSRAPLTCCFEFQGARQLRKTSSNNLVPSCLQRRFADCTTPFIVEKGIHCHQGIVPMKELAGEASTHDIIHDKKHEMTQEGIMTESPPLKNLL